MSDTVYRAGVGLTCLSLATENTSLLSDSLGLVRLLRIGEIIEGSVKITVCAGKGHVKIGQSI